MIASNNVILVASSRLTTVQSVSIGSPCGITSWTALRNKIKLTISNSLLSQSPPNKDLIPFMALLFAWF